MLFVDSEKSLKFEIEEQKYFAETKKSGTQKLRATSKVNPEATLRKMAIAFNIPSEREATEENFSRLNRLLAELYEVLCHILVARQQPGQEAQETRRGECPREPITPPYHLRCNSTYIVSLMMVVAILKVSLASSSFNTVT